MTQSTDVDIPRLDLRPASEKKLLAVLWLVAILAGLLQALAQRFYIEPDGVNYLDVANAYLHTISIMPSMPTGALCIPGSLLSPSLSRTLPLTGNPPHCTL